MSERVIGDREWLRVLAEYERGGRTVRDFCELLGINYSSLKNKKYALAKRPSSAVEVIEVTPTNEPGMMRVWLFNGRQVENPPGGSVIQTVYGDHGQSKIL